jgi:hypothetical protein
MPSKQRRALCAKVTAEAERLMATKPAREIFAYRDRKVSPRFWAVHCVNKAAESIGGLTQEEVLTLCLELGDQAEAGLHEMG